MFDLKGNPDVCRDEKMSVKSRGISENMWNPQELPLSSRECMSVRDAVKCMEIGVWGNRGFQPWRPSERDPAASLRAAGNR